MTVESLIKGHEHLELKPYKCTSGKLTIGYGRNLDDRGISEREADILFAPDIAQAYSDARRFVGREKFEALDEVRQGVVIDMAFNLGFTRLSGFRNFQAALQVHDWELAMAEMLNSRWAEQVGRRAERLSKMMRSGEWPEDESRGSE